MQERIAGLDGLSLERFVRRARRAAGLDGSINLLLAKSDVVRKLNRRFRGKNSATDVLSFPVLRSVLGMTSHVVGEIVISADIARRNADSLGHSAVEEVKILVLHGILHLAGFDHERDNGEMARVEMRLRQRLQLPVGLIERAQAVRQGSRARGPRSRRTA